jgi:hypothetical protein
MVVRAQQDERVRRIGVLMPFDENDPGNAVGDRRQGDRVSATAAVGQERQ